MKYAFRKAQAKELEAIFRIYTQVMKPFISRIWDWDTEWQKADFVRHFVPDNIVVVLVGKKLVGYCQVEDQGECLFIRMLIVLPAHQHQGIGSSFIRNVFATAKEESKYIKLEVFKINDKAIAFYKHHGFQQKSESAASYIMVYGTN